MTGAEQNICLLDLGLSEAVSNRWLLNLPLASNNTNKQHRPGALPVRRFLFFKKIEKNKKEKGKENKLSPSTNSIKRMVGGSGGDAQITTPPKKFQLLVWT